MNVSIDVSELVAFGDDLAAAAVRIVPAAGVATRDAAEEIRSRAEATAPRLTGELAAGFEVEGHGLDLMVINRTRQAFFQEFGTSRHGPQPSLYPAANRVESSYFEALEDAAVEVLE